MKIENRYFSDKNIKIEIKEDIVDTFYRNMLNVSQQINLEENVQNEKALEYNYICIKKEFFDVSMVYLNYINIKKRNNIEIIYKSPSVLSAVS